MKAYSTTLPVSRRGGISVVGEITTKGKSTEAANRYIDTAREMQLIVRIGREWQNTKTGNVLAALPSNKNIFQLSMAQRFILLRTLLETDYLYLKVLIDLIPYRGQSNDPGRFRVEVSSCIENLLKQIKNPNEVQKLKKARKSMDDWESPESYYRENIRAPRLEWLVDLGIVTKWHQRVNYIALGPSASRFFVEPDLTTKWINANYAKAFHECFKEDLPKSKRWTSLSEKSQQKFISKYIGRAMQIFRPSPKVDKISAWQFLTYTECMLLVEKGVIAAESDLERALVSLTAQSTKYRFVGMIRRKVDIGYIVLRKART